MALATESTQPVPVGSPRAPAVAPVGAPASDYAARWGLVSYWKLDEAGGVYADSYGANTLTNNNSVVAAASGKVGAGAAQFVAASSQSLSIADNASLRVGGDGDFWLSAWVYPDTIGTTQTVAAKYSGFGTYRLTLLTTGNVRFQLLSAAGAQIGVADSAATLSATTWAHVFAYQDSAGNRVAICINGSVAVTGTKTGITADDAGAFSIGAAGAANFMNGRIDAVAFGKAPPLGTAALATEIRDRLYNGGSGREYPWR